MPLHLFKKILIAWAQLILKVALMLPFISLQKPKAGLKQHSACSVIDVYKRQMYAMIERCASVPTESILFNIDIEGPVNKDKTAVLRTFAKVFYNHLGFYGDDLKIVRLEKFIEEQGKTDQFRDTFEQVNGQSWTEARDSASFVEDDVVRTMEDVLGMSQQSARNWFNSEDTNQLSIAQLVADIKKYVDGKGKNFRLLFMVDEVGQYIGDDGNLMINLQSIVCLLYTSRCV